MTRKYYDTFEPFYLLYVAISKDLVHTFPALDANLLMTWDFYIAQGSHNFLNWVMHSQIQDAKFTILCEMIECSEEYGYKRWPCEDMLFTDTYPAPWQKIEHQLSNARNMCYLSEQQRLAWKMTTI